MGSRLQSQLLYLITIPSKSISVSTASSACLRGLSPRPLISSHVAASSSLLPSCWSWYFPMEHREGALRVVTMYELLGSASLPNSSWYRRAYQRDLHEITHTLRPLEDVRKECQVHVSRIQQPCSLHGKPLVPYYRGCLVFDVSECALLRSWVLQRGPGKVPASARAREMSGTFGYSMQSLAANRHAVQIILGCLLRLCKAYEVQQFGCVIVNVAVRML